MTEDKKIEEVFQKFSLDLDSSLHKRLKIYCIENNKKMRDIVIEAIETILDKEVYGNKNVRRES
jgi:uncharacterized linocin/CFP29 family protein